MRPRKEVICLKPHNGSWLPVWDMCDEESDYNTLLNFNN